MAHEAAQRVTGFLLRVLRDGARPFRYRSGVRALLGYAPASGPEMNFAAILPDYGFQRADQSSGLEFDLPDETPMPEFRAHEDSKHNGRKIEYRKHEAPKRPAEDQPPSPTYATVPLDAAAVAPDSSALTQPALAAEPPTKGNPSAEVRQRAELSIPPARSALKASEPVRVAGQTAAVSSKIRIPNASANQMRASAETVPEQAPFNEAQISAMAREAQGPPAAAHPLPLSPQTPVPPRRTSPQTPESPARRLRQVTPPKSFTSNFSPSTEDSPAPSPAPRPRPSEQRANRTQRLPPAAEGTRPSQTQPPFEDPPPKSSRPAEPAPVVTVQSAEPVDATPPAFWERRHLNHLRLRMRR